MNNPAYTVQRVGHVSTEVFNRTLRNTYALLGMLFVFGAGTAWVSQAMNLRIGFLPFVIYRVVLGVALLVFYA